MAVRHDIQIDQSSTHMMELTWEADGIPVDLTGYEVTRIGRQYQNCIPWYVLLLLSFYCVEKAILIKEERHDTAFNKRSH